MEHTKEPWIHATDSGQVGSIELADGTVIAQTQALVGDSKRIVREANADRIAQCVNACAGIADPEQFISDARSYSHETVSAIVRQRDELLGALEDLERTSGQGAMSDDPCRIKARAAIANAKGA